MEEANRIMKKCDNQESAQYKITSLFSNMLLEIKAYKEGVLFVDKDPSSLTPDILKSTNLKIIHRLVSEDDCRLVAESVGIKKEQYNTALFYMRQLYKLIFSFFSYRTSLFF